MDVLILGSGGLGSVYGGLLAAAGHTVTLVARGAQLAAIRSHGLTLQTPNGIVKPRLRVVEKPAEVSSADIAFVTVKAKDTDSILGASKNLYDETVFASLQNSGNKDTVLASYVGSANVVGAATIVAGALIEPGIVKQTYGGHTWFGELPSGTSKRVENFASALNEAGLPASTTEDITMVKWVKLAHYCAYAGVSCLTRLRLAQIWLDPQLSRIYIRALRECAQVMKAKGITPQKIDGLPPLPKILVTPDEILIQQLASLGKTLAARRATETISMLQDLLKGKKTEADQTLGYVTAQANEHHVEVPTLQTMYTLIRGLERSC
jgi:2-dehydropantoate 2-reductase